MVPTRETVLAAMAEFRSLGSKPFLRKYTRGYPPKSQYLRHEGDHYPLKALWAASHVPAAHHRGFSYLDARREFPKLGFADLVSLSAEAAANRTDSQLDQAALEGQRFLREVSVIRRSGSIVAKAKAFYEAVCVVCDFDFEAEYGALGEGYIECHHIDPLSGRDGLDEVTGIDDLVMLCANCHRMIHRKLPCLTVEELRAEMQTAAN